MGRPRKPLSEQRGNLKVVDIQRKEFEEEAVRGDSDQLSTPPTWLIDATAKKEWNRLIKELEKINIVGNLDLNNLACYCNAYASYRRVTKELKGQPALVDKITQYGKNKVRNPLIDVQKSYAEEMRKFASLCGLTIDSRLKAGSAKVDKQEEMIERRFSAI